LKISIHIHLALAKTSKISFHYYNYANKTQSFLAFGTVGDKMGINPFFSLLAIVFTFSLPGIMAHWIVDLEYTNSGFKVQLHFSLIKCLNVGFSCERLLLSEFSFWYASKIEATECEKVRLYK
jgi:hypothetical protein